MEARIPFLEVSDAILASGAETLYWCMQCGLCTGTCPWRLVPGQASEEFNIRKVQRLGQLGLEGFESENCLFACTTCRACVDRCPRGVDIIGNVRGMRSMLAEVGTIPPSSSSPIFRIDSPQQLSSFPIIPKLTPAAFRALAIARAIFWLRTS